VTPDTLNIWMSKFILMGPISFQVVGSTAVLRESLETRTNSLSP